MKKILIWGTGKNAKKVLRNGINAKLLGFVETNKAMEEFEGHPVYGINEIPKGYDYIVIASIYAGKSIANVKREILIQTRSFFCME